jgi:hypothetical protein
MRAAGDLVEVTLRVHRDAVAGLMQLCAALHQAVLPPVPPIVPATAAPAGLPPPCCRRGAAGVATGISGARAVAVCFFAHAA